MVALAHHHIPTLIRVALMSIGFTALILRVVTNSLRVQKITSRVTLLCLIGIGLSWLTTSHVTIRHPALAVLFAVIAVLGLMAFNHAGYMDSIDNAESSRKNMTAGGGVICAIFGVVGIAFTAL